MIKDSSNIPNTIFFDHDTYDTEYYLKLFNKELHRLYTKPADHPDTFQPPSRKQTEELLMHWALQLGNANIYLKKGGPFGAIIADFDTEDRIPRVVGIGTNHVVPNNDPSAHAEISAIRDAAKRIGKSDLSGLTMISSCECCPMCLSAVMSSGIDAVGYNRTRKEAAVIDFSDEKQYDNMHRGVDTQSRKAHLEEGLSLEKLLDGHDAAIVIGEGKDQQIYYGDNAVDHTNDPTTLGCVQAIRNACDALKVFHLPENAQLISRYKPHPLSLVAADWARIARRRDPDAPTNPSRDADKKDINAIVYIDDSRWETVNNGKGLEHIGPEEIVRQINLPDEQRRISSRYIGEGMPPADALNAPDISEARARPGFDEWRKRIDSTDPASKAERY